MLVSSFCISFKIQAVKTLFKITLLELFLVVSLALRNHCRATVFINSKWSAVKWQKIKYIFKSQDEKTREDHRDHTITLAEVEWYPKTDFPKVKRTLNLNDLSRVPSWLCTSVLSWINIFSNYRSGELLDAQSLMWPWKINFLFLFWVLTLLIKYSWQFIFVDHLLSFSS